MLKVVFSIIGVIIAVCSVCYCTKRIIALDIWGLKEQSGEHCNLNFSFEKYGKGALYWVALFIASGFIGASIGPVISPAISFIPAEDFTAVFLSFGLAIGFLCVTLPPNIAIAKDKIKAKKKQH